MKNTIGLFFILFSLSLFAQEKETNTKTQVVEASCGQCQFKMEGHGCDLAVKIDGNVYFVDGTSIDAHGDAHAKDGFCTTVRKAEVTGEIVEGRFKATTFKLIENKNKPKKN